MPTETAPSVTANCRMLAQFDLNEDGIIDEEERQAAKEARRAARAERRATHIAEFDTDGDELSDEEREGAGTLESSPAG